MSSIVKTVKFCLFIDIFPEWQTCLISVTQRVVWIRFAYFFLGITPFPTKLFFSESVIALAEKEILDIKVNTSTVQNLSKSMYSFREIRHLLQCK